MFENDEVFVVQQGKRARRIEADVRDPSGGIVAIRDALLRDGTWSAVLGVGDPGETGIGFVFEPSSYTPLVQNAMLSDAFPFVVDGGRGRGIVLVEDIRDVPRILRAAGAGMDAVAISAIETLATHSYCLN